MTKPNVKPETAVRDGFGGPPLEQPDGRRVGEGIRRVREHRGIKVVELAAAANLTPSAVSQIERGVTEPSLSSLRRIAGALNVPMFQFLLDAEPRRLIVARSERIRLTLPDRDISYELVSGHAQGAFEVLAMTIAPGGASSAEPLGHTGEECTVVLSGRLIAQLGSRVYEMGPGDSVTIPGDLPHRFENPGEVDAEALTIISPPTF